MLAKLTRWRAVFAAVVFSIGASAAPVSWNDVLHQDSAWYGTAEARQVAENVLAFQTAAGGWPKNADMSRPPSAEFVANTKFDHRAPTFDNNATSTQLVFLAKVITAGGEGRRSLTEAFLRGLDYVLSAQSANGGWPQYFPLIEGYYRHVTFNDDAMVNLLEILRDVAASREPYAFVDAARRERASVAVERGVACILQCQVRQNARLTAWCAQHDEKTLAPVWARNFEPPSLSGAETTAIVQFLMRLETPSPAIRESIDAAVAWLAANELRGIRVEDLVAADGKKDRRTIAESGARGLWARFYELGTDRPIFTGRDKVIHYDFNEIERERRTGYNYLGRWPAKLLNEDYPRWHNAHRTQ